MDFLKPLYALYESSLMITDHNGPSLSYTEFLEKLSVQLQHEEATKKRLDKENE